MVNLSKSLFHQKEQEKKEGRQKGHLLGVHYLLGAMPCPGDSEMKRPGHSFARVQSLVEETRCLLYRPSIIHPSPFLYLPNQQLFTENLQCVAKHCAGHWRYDSEPERHGLCPHELSLMQETSQETGNYDKNAWLMGGQGSLIAGCHWWQLGQEYYGLKKKKDFSQ